ncbi:MAG: YcaO-like family protein [Desertimonas sp.]
MTGLVTDASGVRHGLVRPPTVLPAGAAEPAGVWHASVARDDDLTLSAGGGAARGVADAEAAAVGEALERMAASIAVLPRRRRDALPPGVASIGLRECCLHDAAQRAAPGYPYRELWRGEEWLTEAFALVDNRPIWLPAALVGLGAEHGAAATSSGLAADHSVVTALLRALQELVERDALMTTWMHQLGGRQIATPHLVAELARLGGVVEVFDLTPRFSPHPVALVAATTWLAGRPRPSIGVACRATWDAAVEKAFLECCQGMTFVGHRLARHPDLVGLAAEMVTDFHLHAVFYGANPTRWDDVPLRAFRRGAEPPADAPSARRPHPEQLHELVVSLAAAGIATSYRELTTVELDPLGLRVVRVVAPALTPLHHDHRWPYLGGRAADVEWRYPDAASRAGDRRWPSPFPHPLG